MSKYLTYSLLSVLLILTSCAGGWSDDQKKQINNTCLGSGLYDCDCYVEEVVKAYPNPDDFNNLTQEEKDAVVENCAVEIEAEEEELESF